MTTTDELTEKIRKEAPRVRLTCAQLGIDTERIVVEGDVGLSEAGVPAYAAHRIEIAAPERREDQQGLLGIERDGKTLRWRPGTRLTYAVWRPSFPSDDEYRQVADGMAAAAADWQSICGVEFAHVAEKDTDENLQFGDVSFPVLRQEGGGNTIAMAFFPDDPVNERLVWVFDGFFGANPTFDRIGVLRHELGHALGFRHEHIRPEAPDIFHPEDLTHVVELTKYDPKSVMHYLGPGVGDPQLRFTEHDRTGSRIVYGGPYTEYSFAD